MYSRMIIEDKIAVALMTHGAHLSFVLELTCSISSTAYENFSRLAISCASVVIFTTRSPILEEMLEGLYLRIFSETL